MKKIGIAADTKHVSRYRALLESEWTSDSISEALQLTRDVLATADCEIAFEWEERRGRSGLLTIGADVTEQLRSFMLSFHVDTMPQAVPRLPARRAKEALRLSRSAEELSILLNIQYAAKARFHIMLDDATGFFRSCQSLLVTLGIHFLLPELKSHRLHKEERFARSAIALHIAQIWQDDPSHQAYLSGMLAACRGDRELGRRELEYAFATTSPGEHDYLTTAHILWYHYLDANDFKAAKEFALSLYRLSPREHLEEIQEMVSDTFEACKV